MGNLMRTTTPDDFDNYGKGWHRDEDAEFSFCSPECFIKFMEKLYRNTFNSTLDLIKKNKEESFDVSFAEFKKKQGEKSSFFKQIQTAFSKKYFGQDAIKEADKLIAELQEMRKELKKSSSGVQKK